jgi:integrase
MGVYARQLKRGKRFFFSGQYLNVKYFSRAIYLTKSECLKAEREQLRKIDEEARRPMAEVLLLNMINARLDYLKTKSQFYYKESRAYFKMLLDQIGDKPIDEVTRLEINQVTTAYSDYLAKAGKTQHKANAMLRIFKAAFNYGYNLYEIDRKNPCTGLKLHSVAKNLKYIPTDKQINAVKDLCDQEEKLLIDFAMQSGGRIGEILAFKRDDMQNGSIYLYTRKSRNSDLVARKMPIPECIKTLKWQGRLFKRWNVYPRFLEKKVKKLEQPFWGFHNLRHRFASKLSKEGRPLFEISQLLGHTSVTTTQIYLQLLGE